MKARERLELIADLPVLEVTEEVADLAEELIVKGIVPEKAASDAIHIAVASVHEVEFLVTWNFKHIANPFSRESIRKIVNLCGFRLPTMCSPEELLEYDDDS